MWNTKWFKDLVSELELFPVSFQQCMLGGRRDEWSTFYTNNSAFKVLELECDRSHEHLAWGVSQSTAGWVFSTASEAEYPQELCTAVAKVVKSLALDFKVSFLLQKFQSPNHCTPRFVHLELDFSHVAICSHLLFQSSNKQSLLTGMQSCPPRTNLFQLKFNRVIICHLHVSF